MEPQNSDPGPHLSSFTLFPQLPAEIRLKIWYHALPGPRIVEVFVRGHHLQYLADATARVREESSDMPDSSPPPASSPLPASSPPSASSPAPSASAHESSNIDDIDSSLIAAALGNSETIPTENAVERDDVASDADDNDDIEADSISSSDSDYSFSPYEPRIYTSQAKIPTILQVNHESREVALKHYKLRFGTSLSPGRIYFNDHLDTLFIPNWSPPESSGELLSSIRDHCPYELAGIRKLAWHITRWYWTDFGKTDNINGQLEPMAFPDLEELVLVTTPPHPSGECDCCLEPERPKVLGEVRLVEAWSWEKSSHWVTKLREESMLVLNGIQARNPWWKMPEFEIRSLNRDGVLTYM